MKFLQRIFEPGERRRLRRAYKTLNEFAKVVKSVERSSTYSGEGLDVEFALSILFDDARPLGRDLVVIRRELPAGGIPWQKAKVANGSLSWLKQNLRELKRDFHETGDAARLTALDRPFEKLERAIWELYGPTTKFQRKLAGLMTKCDVTPYSRVMVGRVSESYISRLLRGERRNPSRGAVLTLASAIEEHASENECGISPRELNGLVKAAGYRPPRSKWKP